MPDNLYTDLPTLKKIYSGKVRDLYEIDEKRMLIVASDRLSAFDVILGQPIPDKGKILTAMSNFWFDKLSYIVPNHLTGEPLADVVSAQQWQQLNGRAVIAKRLQPLPVEAIVRGYLAGSAWKTYQQHGLVGGIVLPAGLQPASALPEPMFTPSTKAAIGSHDENISFSECCDLIGQSLAEKLRATAIALYEAASQYALTRGIIICDTKFEFGIDENGLLTLMDEVLTPDSSRFWLIERYHEGSVPASFDKQFIRDWLESSGWNKEPPPPTIPLSVRQQAADKYREVLTRLIA